MKIEKVDAATADIRHKELLCLYHETWKILVQYSWAAGQPPPTLPPNGQGPFKIINLVNGCLLLLGQFLE